MVARIAVTRGTWAMCRRSDTSLLGNNNDVEFKKEKSLNGRNGVVIDKHSVSLLCLFCPGAP
jgi:hypothetical protein